MDINEVKVLWDKIGEELAKELPDHVYRTWITPLEAVDFENNTMVLLSPHPMAVDILKKNWAEQIKFAIRKIIQNDNGTFSLTYDADFAEKYVKERKKELAKYVSGQKDEDKNLEDTKASLAQMQSGANLNLNLKFDNFVVGENSQFAYNAAFSVANNPSKKFNPLFIYGASGLGKTHLMQAIGHYIIFNNSKLKVRYIRMEEYFNEWVKCFQFGDDGIKKRQSCNNSLMRKFHQKFQNIDILLMDDIQFIESKMKTMEDFFSTFEALYTNNKQIVIASDRLPKDIPTLDNRLRTRFEMGLVVDITPPNFETRCEIVREYAKNLEVDSEEEVFSYIAENFTNNVRELKGAFNKVSAFAEFSNQGLTLALAKKVLNCEGAKNEITINDIAQKTANYFDVTVKDLKSTARQQKIAKARHYAIYLAREVLNMSYEAIGEYFSKKHTTIMYSHDIIKGKLETSQEAVIIVEEIKALLKR